MGCNTSKADQTHEPLLQQRRAVPQGPTLLDKVGGKAAASSSGIKLGSSFPDFECETTHGNFKFHDYLGRAGLPEWTVLFTHSHDFDPVGTTELAVCSVLVKKFAAVGVKLIGLSCGAITDHHVWCKDVLTRKQQQARALALPDPVDSSDDLGFPLIADDNCEISRLLGILQPSHKDAASAGAMNAVFCIGPDKTNRATVLHPEATGRNFAEILRMVSSLLFSQDQLLATPGNWKANERVLVAQGATAEEAQAKFANIGTKQVPSGKDLRFADCPKEPSPVPPSQWPMEPVCATGLMVKVGAAFPDFDCRTTEGDFRFHKYLESDPAWTVMFTHPRDFSPVSTTELAICEDMASDFRKQGAKLIAMSQGTLSEHKEWAADIMSVSEWGADCLSFPMIADENNEIAMRLGILDGCERDATAARAAFIISPDRTNLASFLYPANTGLNLTEVLRVLRALQMTHLTKLAAPAGWESGEQVLAADPEAEEFASVEATVLPSQRKYLRYTDCPACFAGTPSRAGDMSPVSTVHRDLFRQGSVDTRVTVFEVETRKVVCC